MGNPNDKGSLRVTKKGFKVDGFDDFLPNGRSLRFIAEMMRPNFTDVQQDFILRPHTVEVRLSRIGILQFRREFHICRWLDLLELMGLRVSGNPRSGKKNKAADPLIGLLRVIDWRRGGLTSFWTYSQQYLQHTNSISYLRATPDVSVGHGMPQY